MSVTLIVHENDRLFGCHSAYSDGSSPTFQTNLLPSPTSQKTYLEDGGSRFL
jgi:hypothetical protein